MNPKLFNLIIQHQGSIILDEYEDGCAVLDYDIPIWNVMSDEQKIEAIKYVVENPKKEYFAHSGCCQPKHQATAYFICESFRDEFDLFEDTDFNMASLFKNEEELANK